MSNLYDTIVIGAGQAGLASAYYLQRARSRFLVLDGGGQIGESWLRRWDSLRLFTPVRCNSLPGLPFPRRVFVLVLGTIASGSFGVSIVEHLRSNETVPKIIPATRQNSAYRANGSQLARLGNWKKEQNFRGKLRMVGRRISV